MNKNLKKLVENSNQKNKSILRAFYIAIRDMAKKIDDQDERISKIEQYLESQDSSFTDFESIGIEITD